MTLALGHRGRTVWVIIVDRVFLKPRGRGGGVISGTQPPRLWPNQGGP